MPIHFRAACLCSAAGGRIKRDSAYRLGFVVVEYRWHPLQGKKLRLYRRTVHAGASVIHVDTDEKVSRELPAWMVDASICRGMELGSPQVSVAGLRELREVVQPSPQATAHLAPGLVSSLKKENESGEPYAKFAEPAVAAAVGVRERDCTERGRKGRSDSHAGRPAAGSNGSAGGRRGQGGDRQ